MGLAGERVQVELDDKAGMIDLPFEGISRAKLVLTDALLEASRPEGQN